MEGIVKKSIINKRYIGGYLTIYVALSMTVLLTLALVLIEGVRRNAIRMETEIITEIGLNSILAEYHQELFKQYNLFYIDTSYGTNNPSWQMTQIHLENYLEKNCNTTDVLGGWWYKDFIALSVDSVDIKTVVVATDNEGIWFKKRAVEAIKADVGVETLEEVIKWLDIVEEQGKAKEKIDKDNERKSIQTRKEISLSDTQWNILEEINPMKQWEEKRSAGIASLFVSNNEEISQARVDLSRLCSYRKKLNLLNEGNKIKTIPESNLLDELLFQEYLLNYSGFFGNTLDKGFSPYETLQYQIEYIINGKDNDIDNLKGVIYRMSALREASNAAHLFADEEKCTEAELVATLIASAVLLPEIAPILKTVILIGWTFAETAYDMKALLSGSKVPLIKNTENWHFSLNNILSIQELDGSDGWEEGLKYEDYLRILLALTKVESKIFRMLDVIELDIRRTRGNRNFRIDGCIDYVETEIEFSSKYGYEHSILREKEY